MKLLVENTVEGAHEPEFGEVCQQSNGPETPYDFSVRIPAVKRVVQRSCEHEIDLVAVLSCTGPRRQRRNRTAQPEIVNVDGIVCFRLIGLQNSTHRRISTVGLCVRPLTGQFSLLFLVELQIIATKMSILPSFYSSCYHWPLDKIITSNIVRTTVIFDNLPVVVCCSTVTTNDKLNIFTNFTSI